MFSCYIPVALLASVLIFLTRYTSADKAPAPAVS